MNTLPFPYQRGRISNMDVIETLELHGGDRYIDMIEPLKTGSARVIYSSEVGVVVVFENNTAFTALFDKTRAEELFSHIPTSIEVVESHETEFNMVLEKEKFEVVTPCFLYAYLSNNPVKVADRDFFIMDESYVDEVEKTYHLLTDRDYILDRLNERSMIGICYEGEFAGFMGTHAEGAMGLLEILPPFRRQYLAFDLEGEYINRLCERGRVPYCNVIVDNKASIALQEKLGLVVVSETADWYQRRVN